MRRAVLWDSSAILALIDQDDRNHQSAVEIGTGLAKDRRAAFITNYIEAEAHALLLRRVGRVLASRWLLAAGLPVLDAQRSEVEAARSLIARFSDKDWSLCDAISFAMMQKRSVRTAFSFDHHFGQFGSISVLGLDLR
jgi:predicted nucleic acid-binding protein